MSSSSASASSRLRALQSLPANRICVDCSQKSPQWASISYGVFMCLDCSGKHRGLGVHLSFVRSVSMDSWNETYLKKMESNQGGNEAFNAFLLARGIPKATDITSKYNTNAAGLFRQRIQSLADNVPWVEPPAVQEFIPSTPSKPPKQPLTNSGWNWDSWDNKGSNGGGDIKGNPSVVPSRSRSSNDLYGKFQVSAANKEKFFAMKMAENEMKPEGLPPSQGGKYVGFGSTGTAQFKRCNSHYDISTFSDTAATLSQGFGRLASAVQAGTKELTCMVTDGVTEDKLNTITSKTTEIGQMTWGVMKDVMGIASPKDTREEAQRLAQADSPDQGIECRYTNVPNNYEEKKVDEDTFSKWNDWNEDSSIGHRTLQCQGN